MGKFISGKPLFTCIQTLLVLLILGTGSTAQSPEKISGYIECNGIPYYYEIHGKGDPILLLHGGLGSLDMFQPILSMIKENRQVILVDLHGHGRTILGERDLRINDMADDVAKLLTTLEYKKVDVLGYSLGAGVVLRMTIQHPELLARVALVSCTFSFPRSWPSNPWPMRRQLK